MACDDSAALFTMSELTSTFRLLLDADRARELAAEWFETFADEVDASGRFVLVGEGWRESIGSAVVWPSTGGAAPPDDYRWLLAQSPQDRELLVMGLTDFVLDLIAARYPEKEDRINCVRGGDARAARARVAAMRLVLMPEGRLHD